MEAAVPTTGFSLAAYGRLIAELQSRGYRIADYTDAQASKPDLILRHDVDVCIARALAMAEYEAAHRLISTYFVLLRNPLYNLLQPENLDALKKIVALGHRIGLHFDASLYPVAETQEAIARECEILEKMLHTPITIISFHRPAKELLNSPDLLAGRLHAYMPRFFSEMGYCADSRGAWYRGAPLENEAVRNGTALQLLTHPIWWAAQESESATDKLIRLVAEREGQYKEALATNITPYQEILNAA